MATPSPAVKPQPAAANGTKEPASEAMPEPMDVDRTREETSVQQADVVANGKAKELSATAIATAAAEVTVSVPRNVESAAETSRKLVERAQRRLQIQMQYVENARRKILDETHPDMAERLQVFVEERDRLLRVAKQRSDYFQHGTAVIFDYECDEANSEYELHCEKLRQDMLEEIHHEMEILNDQRKGGHTFARTTTRKTRSTRNKNGTESNFALDTAQKIKKRAGYVFQPLENKLGQSEIDHDVRELSNIYEASKKRRMEFDTDGEITPVAKYYRNKFLYRDWVFQEGDEVYVLNYPASSEYAAVICGITSTELLVLSEKGKYYRLVIMDIRQGRVVLTTLSSEQAASRDDLGDASP
ncbi:Thioredoxinlike protein [Phytophthora cinnamomi]|uniref:Thioredoxinlike protein n=1 Tax=Phytophthora cinnamomi TaxID=4785 RepID=UPI003559986B|nr:Thioredoxinlike protein [Phytophthora cinnamomi]